MTIDINKLEQEMQYLEASMQLEMTQEAYELCEQDLYSYLITA